MRATASHSKTTTLAVTQAVFIGRDLRHSIRNAEAMITAMMSPIMLILLFTYVFGGALDPSGQYVDYVVPGIILLCAGFGSSSTAVDVSQDMTNGIIDRFRTMPIQSISVITGHVVASLARNMLATFVVIAVALLVGFRTSAGLLEWILAIGLIALFIFAFTWLYAAIGLVAGDPRPAAMDSPCSSSPTSPVPSFLPRRCRHGRKGLQATSRLRRSSSPFAGC